MTQTTERRGTTGIAVADFLLDRLQEDYDIAYGAEPSPWREGKWDGSFDGPREVLGRHGDVTARAYYGGTYGHILHFDPTKVIRDIEAKMAVVERCAAIEALMPSQHLAFGVLWELAQAYRSHPDFREAWAA